MAQEVFTAVPQGPTRAFHVTAQRLFQHAHAATEYLWLIEYEYDFAGLPEGGALAKLKTFGAQVGMSNYTELLTWPTSSNASSEA